jgi:hypothetical protein
MGGKTKRKLSDWNKFVMKVKAENPEKKFGDVLKMAGKMKRQGVKIGEYVNNKTMKVVKKIKNSAKSVIKKVRKTGKKLAKKNKKAKRKTAKKT